MPQASWNGAVVAQTEKFETVEGNVYFPPGSANRALLKPSDTHTTCSWKGVASYYDVVVDGKVNKDAAWYYPRTASRSGADQGPHCFLERRDGRKIVRCRAAFLQRDAAQLSVASRIPVNCHCAEVGKKFR